MSLTGIVADVLTSCGRANYIFPFYSNGESSGWFNASERHCSSIGVSSYSKANSSSMMVSFSVMDHE